MKFYYLTTALICLSLTAICQDQATDWKSLSPTERATKLTDWMDEELNLTDIQESNVFDVNLKYAKKTESLKNSNLSRREKFQTLKQYDKAKDLDLQEYLYKDQFETYEQKKKELMEKIRKNKVG
jgi:hypothetical protein